VARFVVDGAMLVLAVAATTFGAAAAGAAPPSPPWTAAFGLIVVLLLAVRGLYAPAFQLRTIDDVRRVAAATSIAANSSMKCGVVSALPATFRRGECWSIAAP